MRNKLRLAIATQASDNLPLPDIYREIASFGIRYVILSFNEETNIKEFQDSLKDFSQLALKCVQIKSSALPESYIEDEGYHKGIEEIEKLLEIQKIYGGRQIGISTGSFVGKKEKYLEAAVKFIREACEKTTEYDMYCALDIQPKENHLLQKWSEIKELFGKVDKDNLLINANTALLHHLETSEEDMDFLKGKSALIEIEDIESDEWATEINIGEGIADIAYWVEKCEPIIYASCAENQMPSIASVIFKNSDENEIKRTFNYLEHILPKVSF